MSENKIKRKKIVITDFSKINLDKNDYISDEFYIKEIYNLAYKNGAIKASKGIQDLSCPSNFSNDAPQMIIDFAQLNAQKIEGLYHFSTYFPVTGNTDNYIFFYADNMVYYFWMFMDFNGFLPITTLHFDKAPVCFYYKKDDGFAVLFSNDTDDMMVWIPLWSPYALTNVPKITSMCELDGILFCTVGGAADKIWYTKTLNPEDIGSDTSGSLGFNDVLGPCRKVINFKGYLYVFRDYGLSKVTYYNENSIKVDNIYYGQGKIYSETVAICGSYMVFLSSDGLYACNGTSVEKINVNFDNLIFDVNNEKAVAASLQGNYYLAVRADFGDDRQILCEEQDYINNAVIILNMTDNSFEVIRGVDINNMLTIKTTNLEKVALTFNSQFANKVGQFSADEKIFDNSTVKHFKTNKVAINNHDFTVVRKLKVVANAQVRISLVGDGETLTFETVKNGENVFDFILRTKYLQIVMDCDVDPELKLLELNIT